MPRTRRQEIDHRTIKLLVGLIALSLATLTSVFASNPIESISASYYEGGWSQTIFIGFLFAIAAFLLAYNGEDTKEMVLGKVAAIAAFGIALFPCECDGHEVMVKGLHGIAAAVMFLVLAYFCLGFYRRAKAKGTGQALARASIYAACGAVILVSIAGLAYDHFSGGALSAHFERFVFYGEAAGLVSFGISWLTASRTLPVLTRPEERFSLLRGVNPD